MARSPGALNPARLPTEELGVTVQRDLLAEARADCEIGPGTILVSPSGQVRIIRSRTSDKTGWNCADGAAIRDEVAIDTDRWNAFSPAQLAADLALAAELRELGGHRSLGGGLATWDACSGRPCVLPKLAKLAH